MHVAHARQCGKRPVKLTLAAEAFLSHRKIAEMKE
jgi:hypothetical protein